MVGTSGSCVERCFAAIASGRSCPDFRKDIVAGPVSKVPVICPPIRSVIAGPLPL